MSFPASAPLRPTHHDLVSLHLYPSVLTVHAVHRSADTIEVSFLHAVFLVSFFDSDLQVVFRVAYLLGVTDRVIMMGIGTLGDLLCLTQIMLGGDAQTNRTSFEPVVPRREILYVGGRYTNITASLIPYYTKCI